MEIRKLNNEINDIAEKVDDIAHDRNLSDNYWNMINSYKNELHEIVDHCHPGESSYATNMFVTYLRFMRDFYQGGEGVYAMEMKDEDPKRYKNEPTRLETLEKALYYYDKWQGVEEEYIKVVLHPETYKSHDNKDGTVTVDDLGFHCEYKYGPKGTSKKTRRKAMKITYKKMKKQQLKWKKKFYKVVFKYMESWWD